MAENHRPWSMMNVKSFIQNTSSPPTARHHNQLLLLVLRLIKLHIQTSNQPSHCQSYPETTTTTTTENDIFRSIITGLSGIMVQVD